MKTRLGPSSAGVVLVTGPNGFVGCALAEALKIRASRRALRRPAVDALPGDTLVGDIGPDTDWWPALKGIDCVVHLAARTHVMNEQSSDPLDAYRRVNVLGTTRLAQQAAMAGVRRLVFLSTVKVNGEATTSRPYTEDDSPIPEDAYGVSKYEAENALRQISAETGMEIVILRPPLVYGHGVKGNFLQLLRLINRGIPLPLASVRNQRSLIYVHNLADAIVRCIDTPAAAGRTYLVSDGEEISTPELILKLASAMDRRPRLFPCPSALLHIGATLVGKRAQALRLTGSLVISNSRIRNELAWRPPYSLDQGLIATAQWYHQSQN